MNQPVTIACTEKWTVADANGDAGVRVTLSLPVDTADDVTHLLVLLDGDTMFLTATEFARTVRRVTQGMLPQIAVVGLMRDEPDPLRYISSRFRDFTPQEWVLPGPFAPDNAFAIFGTGGASAFLGVIEDMVLPQVRERLHDAGFTIGDTAIGGWSLSGLFASWAWAKRPDVFRHLIAISPSLWWDDASILDESLAPRPDGQRAFICAGEHEEGDVEKVWPRIFANAEQRELAAMVSNAARFSEMASTAGAAVEYRAFPDEHHVTLQAAAVTRGLRFIFG